jgi:hypothetical protein
LCSAREEIDKCDIKDSLQIGYALSLLAVSKDFFSVLCYKKNWRNLQKKKLAKLVEFLPHKNNPNHYGPNSFGPLKFKGLRGS